jgi:hypothetical protein
VLGQLLASATPSIRTDQAGGGGNDRPPRCTSGDTLVEVHRLAAASESDPPRRATMISRVSATAVIDAAPDVVFAQITDLGRLDRWNEAITEVIEAPPRVAPG